MLLYQAAKQTASRRKLLLRLLQKRSEYSPAELEQHLIQQLTHPLKQIEGPNNHVPNPA